MDFFQLEIGAFLMCQYNPAFALLLQVLDIARLIFTEPWLAAALLYSCCYMQALEVSIAVFLPPQILL